MRKKIVAGLLTGLLVSVGVTSAGVGATPAQTDVTGVVTENHTPVANATVTVECQGNLAADTTDAQGSYLVTYPIAQCPFGSTVKVTAQKDGKSGTASGTVHGITTKLNLAIVNVPIPEYGALGALLAVGAGVGSIVYLRRRQELQLSA